MAFCQVIVDIAHEDVDRVFTYRVPEGMNLCPGMRVHVPFGRVQRVEGVVVAMPQACDLPPERVRDVTDALEDWEDDGVCRRISLATGEAAADFLREEIGRVKQRFPGLDCTVYAIHNDYFGDNITVAGLVTATDLIRQLKGKELGEELLIPGVMLRHEQDKFLDDGTIEDVQQALGVSVRTVDNDGTQFLLALLGIEDDAEYAW